MESLQREKNNEVIGSSFSEEAVTYSRDNPSLQVFPDHHQALAGGQKSHGERVTTGRNSATAGTSIVFRIATWNVNTLEQSENFENHKKQAPRKKIDTRGYRGEIDWSRISGV